MRRFVACVALCACGALCWSSGGWAQAAPGAQSAQGDVLASRSDVIEFVDRAIASGEGAAAQAVLQSYLNTHKTDSALIGKQAVAAFYAGDYEQTVALIETLLAESKPLDDELVVLDRLAKSTLDATKGFVRVTEGDFVILHAPGPDARLVPYAFDALRAAQRTLKEELGIDMKSPVRLEIYPNADLLSRVSTLSVEAIRRTGTIALCKWGKLMIASPRALLRGYPWLDTIAHEYVHLVVTKRTGDRAPVWLQEGLAKFLETRWRLRQSELHLEPAAERILIDSAKSKELLSFKQLHPSIAMLPSQRDAVLAFAQVSSFVADFYDSFGAEGLRGVLERVAEGRDARHAVASVAGSSFPKLEAQWRKRVGKRKPKRGLRLLPTLLKEESSEIDEVSVIKKEHVRKYLQLGDMLWSRSRPKAAVKEYAKAHRSAPSDPVVASRFARSALQSGRPSEAIEPLQKVLKLYPSHAPAYATLARAYHALAQHDEAVQAAKGAIRHNPFDPQPHCILAATEGQDREQEARFCTEMGGTVP